MDLGLRMVNSSVPPGGPPPPSPLDPLPVQRIRCKAPLEQEDTMNEVVIAGAARTPIGTFGGSFAEVPATRLGAVAIAEALKRAGVKPEQVDEVLMGNVLSAGLGMNPARQAALAAGVPDSTPAAGGDQGG